MSWYTHTDFIVGFVFNEDDFFDAYETEMNSVDPKGRHDFLSAPGHCTEFFKQLWPESKIELICTWNPGMADILFIGEFYTPSSDESNMHNAVDIAEVEQMRGRVQSALSTLKGTVQLHVFARCR
jgi:hypothetical protein